MSRRFINNQRGSILVGVLALSLAMTIVAGGYLLVVANGNKDAELATKDLGLYYSADAGLLRGVRWMRSQNPTYFGPSWTSNLLLTDSPEETETIDGIRVKVVLYAPPLQQLKCTATRGAGYDTLIMIWRFDGAVPTVTTSTSLPTIYSDITMSHRTETLIPGIQ